MFREGLETVLFYEAVAAGRVSAPDQSLLLTGFLTGCGALAALFVGFQKLGPRIPMRAFFNVTGGLLYFMAFRFAGAGIRELQEAGVVGQTPCDWVPDTTFLAQWLGVFPYVEPFALQALLLALAIFALVTMIEGRSNPRAAALPGRSPGLRPAAAESEERARRASGVVCRRTADVRPHSTWTVA